MVIALRSPCDDRAFLRYNTRFFCLVLHPKALAPGLEAETPSMNVAKDQVFVLPQPFS
jgi:hypothetical protein